MRTRIGECRSRYRSHILADNPNSTFASQRQIDHAGKLDFASGRRSLPGNCRVTIQVPHRRVCRSISSNAIAVRANSR
jgi:hypothetical protein